MEGAVEPDARRASEGRFRPSSLGPLGAGVRGDEGRKATGAGPEEVHAGFCAADPEAKLPRARRSPGVPYPAPAPAGANADSSGGWGGGKGESRSVTAGYLPRS